MTDSETEVLTSVLSDYIPDFDEVEGAYKKIVELKLYGRLLSGFSMLSALNGSNIAFVTMLPVIYLAGVEAGKRLSLEEMMTSEERT